MVVKQVSNSHLKKIQIFKRVSILLFFHHIESNLVSLVLLPPQGYEDMGIAYLLKMGLVLKSEVRF